MTKHTPDSQANPALAGQFNSIRDYVTFALLLGCIIAALVALYVYDLKTNVFDDWASQFYIFLLN
jgi:hypothetical protein